jgi:hypothetical protein
MIDLLKRIPRQTSYKMLKHAEVALPESASVTAHGAATEPAKPIKRWHTTAKANNDTRTFPERLEESIAARKKHTIFVDSAVQKAHDTRDLLALTAAHIEQNLVRIGKKYYRQKAGIPQGSVLSSTLCNYFYADLELTQLSFLLPQPGQLQQGEEECEEDCLLLRLIDDFLLITTDRAKARRFVEVMHRGVPQYGVTVNPGKSLVNFELAVRGMEVPRVEEGGKFPYCGLLIDCGTLAVTKLREQGKGSGESDTYWYTSLELDGGVLTTTKRSSTPSLSSTLAARAGTSSAKSSVSSHLNTPSLQPPSQTSPLFANTVHKMPSRSNPTSCSLTRCITRTAGCAATYTRRLSRRRPRCGRIRGAYPDGLAQLF